MKTGEELYRKAMNMDESVLAVDAKIDTLWQASKLGYIPAMVEFGRLKLEGKGFMASKDSVESGLKMLRKAALLGSVEATHMLQDHYRPAETDVRSDRYGEKAYARAMAAKPFDDDMYVESLFEATKKYHPQAIFEMGSLYLDDESGQPNTQKALTFIKIADQLGNPEACRFMDEVLGRRKEESEMPEDAQLLKAAQEAGVRKDYKTMYSLLEQAAAMGNLMAHITLGRSCRLGIGMERDMKKVFHHYKIVADSGNTEAMIAVGELYDFGDGVPQNKEQARFWYQKAAEGGDVFGMVALAKHYYRMKTSQGNEKAIYWAKKVSSHGKPYSTRILAELVSDPKERAYWKEQYEKYRKTPPTELDNVMNRMWTWIRMSC